MIRIREVCDTASVTRCRGWRRRVRDYHCFLQNAEDVFAFKFFRVRAAVCGAAAYAARVADLYCQPDRLREESEAASIVSLSEDRRRSFQTVAQLAHISRPGIRLQTLPRFG